MEGYAQSGRRYPLESVDSLTASRQGNVASVCIRQELDRSLAKGRRKDRNPRVGRQTGARRVCSVVCPVAFERRASRGRDERHLSIEGAALANTRSSLTRAIGSGGCELGRS